MKKRLIGCISTDVISELGEYINCAVLAAGHSAEMVTNDGEWYDTLEDCAADYPGENIVPLPTAVSGYYAPESALHKIYCSYDVVPGYYSYTYENGHNNYTTGDNVDQLHSITYIIDDMADTVDGVPFSSIYGESVGTFVDGRVTVMPDGTVIPDGRFRRT